MESAGSGGEDCSQDGTGAELEGAAAEVAMARARCGGWEGGAAAREGGGRGGEREREGERERAAAEERRRAEPRAAAAVTRHATACMANEVLQHALCLVRRVDVSPPCPQTAKQDEDE